MDLCLVYDIQLCYNKSEIRAALRAICDAAVFRTRCRSETDENPIRAAKRRFEPRGTRLPDARISKPHPRKGTETFRTALQQKRRLQISKPHPRKGTETINHVTVSISTIYFKTTSPQGDGNQLSNIVSTNCVLFQNHIPARGRKQTIPLRLRAGEKLFQNHIPARGRKQHHIQHNLQMGNNFKTTSPQGDGN